MLPAYIEECLIIVTVYKNRYNGYNYLWKEAIEYLNNYLIFSHP